MSGSSGMERRPLPPLPQKQQVSPQQQQTSMVQKQIASSVSSYTSGGSDLTQDYDSTPKADYYADQLRAQARRLSENQPRMLNAARYQSKPLPEMKTNIIKSRPVDGQPRPQEARPLSASTTSSGSSAHSPNSPQEMSPPSIALLTTSSRSFQHPLYRSSEFDRGLNFVGITTENGAQSTSSDSLTSPSSSTLVNSSPSQLSSQDYNANHRNKLDSVSPSDSASTQVSSPGRRQSDYHSDASPVVKERLLGNHNAVETPELPPPPTPLSGDNTSGLMDETFSPPPMPSPLDNMGAMDEHRKKRSVDEEGTPNRYDCFIIISAHVLLDLAHPYISGLEEKRQYCLFNETLAVAMFHLCPGSTTLRILLYFT